MRNLTDEETEMYNKKLESEAIDVPNQHFMYVDNSIYHVEMYIKRTERDKVIIADAIRHIEEYIERNSKILSYFDIVEQRQGMTLNDVIYYLNKIKELVKEEK